MFKAIALSSIIALSISAGAATDKPYEKFGWGARIEKGRGYEAIGLEVQTKALYKFMNWSDMEIHHALVIGVNTLQVNNVVTDLSGKFTEESALNPFLGIRVFNSANTTVADIAVTYLAPSDDLAKDDSIGGLLRFGYLIPYQSKENGRTHFFNVGASYTFGLDKADKLASKPDLFNGFGLHIAFLF